MFRLRDLNYRDLEFRSHSDHKLKGFVSSSPSITLAHNQLVGLVSVEALNLLNLFEFFV